MVSYILLVHACCRACRRPDGGYTERTDQGIRPHGLLADKDGDIWFTGISVGYVGKLDPKTGKITEYRALAFHKSRSFALSPLKSPMVWSFKR
jgi:streptogramin lyase